MPRPTHFIVRPGAPVVLPLLPPPLPSPPSSSSSLCLAHSASLSRSSSSSPSQTPPPPDTAAGPLVLTVQGPGRLVPLIAVDQLPDWLEIVGVPRELRPAEAAGMVGIGGYGGSVGCRDEGVFQVRLLGEEGEEGAATGAGGKGSQKSPATTPDDDSALPPPAKSPSLGPLPSKTRAEEKPTVVAAARTPPKSKATVYKKTPGMPCRHWCRFGKCAYGINCRYIHVMPQTAEALEQIGLHRWPAWWVRQENGGIAGPVPKSTPVAWAKQGKGQAAQGAPVQGVSIRPGPSKKPSSPSPASSTRFATEWMLKPSPTNSEERVWVQVGGTVRAGVEDQRGHRGRGQCGIKTRLATDDDDDDGDDDDDDDDNFDHRHHQPVTLPLLPLMIHPRSDDDGKEDKAADAASAAAAATGITSVPPLRENGHNSHSSLNDLESLNSLNSLNSLHGLNNSNGFTDSHRIINHGTPNENISFSGQDTEDLLDLSGL